MMSPARFVDFVSRAMGVMDEDGVSSPSTFALIRDPIMHSFHSPTIIAWSNKIAFVIYLAIVSLIVVLSIRTYRFIGKTASIERERLYIFFGCLVYALVCFRLKDYTFIFLIPPAFYIMQYLFKCNRFAGWFVTAALLLNSNYFLDRGLPLQLLWSYYPLLLVYGLWGIFYAYGATQRYGVSLSDTRFES